MVQTEGNELSTDKLENAISELQEQLAKSDAAVEYQLALDVCPDLVAKESNLEKYLKATNCDVNESARKIAQYWKTRKVVFGEEKWTLPIRLTGKNAFHNETIQMLQRTATDEAGIGGGYLLLPDKYGNTVLFFTRGRLSYRTRNHRLGLTLHHKKQACFWYFHMISMQPTPIFIMVFPILERAPKTFPQINDFFAHCCRDLFPIHCLAIHTVCASNSTRKKYIVEAFLPFLWKVIQGPFSFARRTIDLVVENTRDDEQAAMAKIFVEKYGINPDSLPPTLGGDWDYVLPALRNLDYARIEWPIDDEEYLL